MKKLFAIVLSVVMIFAMAACGEKQERGTVLGLLALSSVSEEEYNKDFEDGTKAVFFDNLQILLSALQTKRVDKIVNLPNLVGRYIAAHNSGVTLKEPAKGAEFTIKYHMGVLKDNKEVYDKVEAVLSEIIADGTLDKIADQYIDEYIERDSDPELISIPVIQGADTIRFAVTGDLPPMDFVKADGTPAGFNVALLAEMSKRMGVNIELVAVDAASRVVALTSNKADVLFWVSEMEYEDKSKGTSFDVDGEQILLTSVYMEDKGCELTKKSE